MKLDVQSLSIARNGREILSNVSFSVNAGECVVVRGKNGAGKSSLFAAMMGLDGVEVVGGDILVDGASILEKKTFERARSGIFLAHQEPPAIDGVSLSFMARAAMEAMCGIADVPEAQARIRAASEQLALPEGFVHKTLNADMSGGEKKRAEMFQLLVTQPKLALLDEIDSGVDAATQEILLKAIESLRSSGTAFVVVTHSDAFADMLKTTRIIEMEKTVSI
jgi:Fe-S cluster assembly ATP-binding protein